MSKVKVLVLTGDGINCEKESARAFELAGALSTIVHINDLLENKNQLEQFQILCLPGGFSFGDELGSGQILAHKIKYGLKDEFYRFVEDKKPILGICNGFQVLTKLGLLPDYQSERTVALDHNLSHKFIDKWTELQVENETVCKWTKNIKTISLPIRHGEGRVCFPKGKESEVYTHLKENGQIALRYTQNPNGSSYDIAGICDKNGLIFGLMPHPEAAVSHFSHVKGSGTQDKMGEGLTMFKNILEIF
jgi:phosphoribosylformylglycinamidine synthase